MDHVIGDRLAEEVWHGSATVIFLKRACMVWRIMVSTHE